MEAVEQGATFPAIVRYRKGKEGKSAFVTIPLPIRDQYGLKEGQIMQFRVLSVSDPAPKKEEKKK
jgi:hypothetical protein